MPFLFLLLPPEVRNQIYGHVFDEEHEIDFLPCYPGDSYYYLDSYPANYARKSVVTGPRASHNAEPSDFTALRTLQAPSYYTAMLQTSWKIYRESYHFLYAKTVFHYCFLSNLQFTYPLKKTFSVFPKESVQRVKDLKIELHRMLRVSLYAVVRGIASFVDEACALERLSVSFDIYRSEIDGPDVAWAQSVLHNEGVLKALTTSNSLRYVCITVRDGAHHDGAGFAALSQAIAAAKGWVCEAQNYNIEPNESDFGHSRSIWDWHLRPASKKSMQGT